MYLLRKIHQQVIPEREPITRAENRFLAIYDSEYEEYYCADSDPYEPHPIGLSRTIGQTKTSKFQQEQRSRKCQALTTRRTLCRVHPESIGHDLYTQSLLRLRQSKSDEETE